MRTQRHHAAATLLALPPRFGIDAPGAAARRLLDGVLSRGDLSPGEKRELVARAKACVRQKIAYQVAQS